MRFTIFKKILTNSIRCNFIFGNWASKKLQDFRSRILHYSDHSQLPKKNGEHSVRKRLQAFFSACEHLCTENAVLKNAGDCSLTLEKIVELLRTHSPFV